MAILDEKLLMEMLQAARGVLDKHWQQVKPMAEEQFRQFGENIERIAELKAKGDITEEQASLQLNIQRNSIKIVLLSVKGLTSLAVESALNAAVDVARKTVNTAIGWRIL
jgi:cobalamin biosynthesis protein CobD/CbiB